MSSPFSFLTEFLKMINTSIDNSKTKGSFYQRPVIKEKLVIHNPYGACYAIKGEEGDKFYCENCRKSKNEQVRVVLNHETGYFKCPSCGMVDIYDGIIVRENTERQEEINSELQEYISFNPKI